MKRIRLNEERREIQEAEVVAWLDVPIGYRLASVEISKKGDDGRKLVVGFVKFDSASEMSIETARKLRADDGA